MNLNDIPIGDILAEIGDDQYRRAQTAELERLEAIRASLAVQYESNLANPFVNDAERATAQEGIMNGLRAAHWAIQRIKERQQAAREVLRGQKKTETEEQSQPNPEGTET